MQIHRPIQQNGIPQAKNICSNNLWAARFRFRRVTPNFFCKPRKQSGYVGLVEVSLSSITRLSSIWTSFSCRKIRLIRWNLASLYWSSIYLSCPSKYWNFSHWIDLSWVTGWCGGCALRSGMEDKYSNMLSVLGGWNLVLYEPSYFTQINALTQKSGFARGKSNKHNWNFLRPQSFHITKSKL